MNLRSLLSNPVTPVSSPLTDRAISAGSAPDGVADKLPYDEAPFSAFHRRVILAAISGAGSDGFEIGVIGLALHSAAPALQLSPLWLGLLGGAALMGLFFGALLAGPLADKIGRRPIFGSNMILIAILSTLQFFVHNAGELFVLRFAIGVLLGTDYVVSKAILMEFSPRKRRGRIMSMLAIAWAAGYVCSYFVGYALAGVGVDGWRWILLSGAIPAIISAPLRLTIPESPAWLVSQGRVAHAARIVERHLGPKIGLPGALPGSEQGWRLRTLFSRRWYRRTIVGATFFTCQVIPYFALGTFVSKVMEALHVADDSHAGLIYNVFLLLGAIVGWTIIDMLPRRTFLIGSFGVASGALAILTWWPAPPEALIIVAFAVVAFTLSAASCLCYVYLTELFPTSLRGSGIGIAVAASRLGSAASTFLLPLVVAALDVRWALGSCVVTTLVGAGVCFAWAPETRHTRLDEIGDDESLSASLR